MNNTEKIIRNDEAVLGINEIWVHSKYRRKGLCTFMLDSLLKHYSMYLLN